MKRVNRLKFLAPKYFALKNELLKPNTQSGFRGTQKCSATCLVALLQPTADNKLRGICATNSHKSKLKGNFKQKSSYDFCVS